MNNSESMINLVTTEQQIITAIYSLIEKCSISIEKNNSQDFTSISNEIIQFSKFAYKKLSEDLKFAIIDCCFAFESADKADLAKIFKNKCYSLCDSYLN